MTSPPSLFEHLLGAAYADLAPSVQRLHATHGARRYRGEAEVDGGSGLFARLFARAARLPVRYRGELFVDVRPTRDGEHWTRRFGTHAMPSNLFARCGALNERLGLARLVFALHVVDGALDWRLAAVRVFALPLPRGWFDGVTARAFEADGRYRFDVAARLPLIGLLVHYRGSLDETSPQPLGDDDVV